MAVNPTREYPAKGVQFVEGTNLPVQKSDPNLPNFRDMLATVGKLQDRV